MIPTQPYRDEHYANKILYGYPVAVEILVNGIAFRVEEALREQVKTILPSLGVVFSPADPWVVVENRMKKAKVTVEYVERPDMPTGAGHIIRKDGIEKAVLHPFVDEVDGHVKVRVVSKL